MATFCVTTANASVLRRQGVEPTLLRPGPGSYRIGGSTSSSSNNRHLSSRNSCGSGSLEYLASVLVAASTRHRSRLIRSAGKDQVRTKETEGEALDYVPSRDELESQQIELLEATGALKLQRKEEAFQERRKWRAQNPSPLDKWQQEMDAVRNDTERRMLWGDLKKKSGGHRRYRGKKVGEEEGKIKFNRGFPLEDTEDQERADQERDRKWLEMWRSTWPEGHALDPHDPESFGFAFVGEVTGAHGVHGDVRVRADDFLCDQGYDPAAHLARRNFSNFTEDSKRVHLKPPHRRFPRPFRILTGKRVQRRVFALRLHGVESPEEVEAENRGTDGHAWTSMTLEQPLFTPAGDALGLIGSRCVAVMGQVTAEVLGEFAAADTPEKAHEGSFQETVVVFKPLRIDQVPDYKIARRHRGRKAAHDLLDISLLGDEVESRSGQNSKFLYEPDPVRNSATVRIADRQAESSVAAADEVLYVPFVPEMIARVEADKTEPAQ
ncbi:unnamed protein product [Symbiodinium pilosum]|uniref:RimM N-terminal domain-containing protein n=1 Tax=Symbiodinium pilosum TaxID=2952 RepID=A0A812XY03_SYMPI|nr:unnamed protein product [Symbiodinium pilosum]